MRATSAAGPRGSRRPARSGPGLPRGTCRHRPLAARSRAAPPPRRARARSYPARSRAAAASTAISCVDIHQTYHRSGLGPAMAEFIALASHQGSIPPGFADQPAPPADFWWPAQDDGSRNDLLFGQNIMSCHRYQHDSGALRAASARVVIAVAAESSTMTARRAAVAVAGRLGTTPATFPGGHDGLPSAARLRPLLDRREPAAGEGQGTAKCANGPDRTRALRASPGSTCQVAFAHSASSATEMGLGAQSRRSGWLERVEPAWSRPGRIVILGCPLRRTAFAPLAS